MTPATIHIRYFAVLREQAGLGDETIATTAASPAALYAELAARHGLHLDPALLRVSINERFADMHTPLHHNDRVVFIPPVSGG